MKRILFLVLTVFVISCTKSDYKKEPEDLFKYIDDYGRQWANFEKGSYWIYKNDTTGVNKDPILYQYHSFYPFYESESNENTEEQHIYFRASDTSRKEDTFHSHIWLYGSGQVIITEMILNSFDHYHYEYSMKFRYSQEKVIEEKTEHENRNTEVIYRDEIKLNNQIFNQVVILKGDLPLFDNGLNNISFEYWYAKNYGIIKKIISTPDGRTKSWSLDSFEIFQ